MDWNYDQAIGYLAAMIDGEGWIGDLKGVHNRAIRIANTEEDIISAVTSCLDYLGITYIIIRDKKPARPNWAKRITVDITRRSNLSYILGHVPFRSLRKRERLERLVSSYRQPLDPDEVRRLYVDEGLTEQQVANRLGASLKRVKNVRRWNNIPSRNHQDRAQSIWAERRRRYGSAGRKLS